MIFVIDIDGDRQHYQKPFFKAEEAEDEIRQFLTVKGYSDLESDIIAGIAFRASFLGKTTKVYHDQFGTHVELQ